MAKILCKNLKQQTNIVLQENILDAFEAINVDLPWGCRAGSCGVCVIEILQGAEQLGAMSGVEKNTLQRLYPEEIKQGKTLRLGCRSNLEKDLSKEIIFQNITQNNKT